MPEGLPPAQDGEYWQRRPQTEAPAEPLPVGEAKAGDLAKAFYDAHKELIQPIKEAQERTVTAEKAALESRRKQTEVPESVPMTPDEWGDFRGELRRPETSNRRDARQFARDNLDVLNNQAADEMIGDINRDPNQNHPAGQNDREKSNRSDEKPDQQQAA